MSHLHATLLPPRHAALHRRLHAHGSPVLPLLEVAVLPPARGARARFRPVAALTPLGSTHPSRSSRALAAGVAALPAAGRVPADPTVAARGRKSGCA